MLESCKLDRKFGFHEKFVVRTGWKCLESAIQVQNAQMEVVVNFFRVNSKMLTSKFWFSRGLISNILV